MYTIYVHVPMCIYACVYVCVYMYIYIYVHVSIGTYIYICVSVHRVWKNMRDLYCHSPQAGVGFPVQVIQGKSFEATEVHKGVRRACSNATIYNTCSQQTPSSRTECRQFKTVVVAMPLRHLAPASP